VGGGIELIKNKIYLCHTFQVFFSLKFYLFKFIGKSIFHTSFCNFALF